MKIHITNCYNTRADDRIANQIKKVAKSARELGFLEMGIFNFDTTSDTFEEQGKRLDGIIAAVENNDTIIIQLPTGNGVAFEKRLFAKIKGYPGTRIILVFHDTSSYDSLASFGSVDKIVYSSERMLNDIHSKGLYSPVEEQLSFSNTNELLIKKNLIEAAEFYDSTEIVDDNNKDIIQAAFGLYDKTGSYALYVGEVIQSVLDNTSEKVHFHVFHDETLTPGNKYKLKKTAGLLGGYVTFYKMNAEDFASDNEWVSYYTIGAMFRLIMPRVLTNLDKLIYLDADLLFNRDIKELWDTDITDYSIAAVKDVIFDNGIIQPKFVKEGIVPKDRYFNSGLLIMNLKKMREMGDLLDLSMQFLDNNPDSALPDQDALNYYFNATALFLDKEWNVFSQYEKKRTSQLTDNVVYHFMGQPHIEYTNPTEFEKLYIKNMAKTAWKYNGVAKELFRGYWVLVDKINQAQNIMPNLVKGKKKIYYSYPAMFTDNLLKMIPPSEGDYFITDDSNEFGRDIYGLKYKALDDLKLENKGDYIIFVAPGANYGRAFDNLKALGLVEGEDYFSIPKILKSSDGGYW